MGQLKSALVCIFIGVLVAVVSCSAIKMAKHNIQIQKQDSSFIPHNLTPPPIPALNNNPIRIYPVIHQRQDFKPFKDSIINGLRNIKEAVDYSNRKLDTGIVNQGTYMGMQKNMLTALLNLQDQVNNLQIDTSKLYERLNRTAKFSSAIKNDAVIGNAFSNFGFYWLCIIGTFVAVNLILTAYLVYRHHKKNPNTNERR